MKVSNRALAVCVSGALFAALTLREAFASVAPIGGGVCQDMRLERDSDHEDGSAAGMVTKPSLTRIGVWTAL
jgi:hypothetical protein